MRIYHKFWTPMYEDDGKGKDDDGKGDDGKGDDGKTFTQDQIDTILAKDRRKNEAKAKDQHTKLMEEVNALKTKATLTSKEREELEGRITELRKANMTAEELQKEETNKIQSDLQSKLDVVTKSADDWRNHFSNSEIKRAIVDAAASHNAFVPAQVVAILKPSTRLVEAVDDDGKPTGEYTPKVTFEDIKEGKPVTLELSPAEAVKRMTEMDNYLNLFKGKGSGGIGGSNRGSGGSGSGSGEMTAAEAAKLPPAAYKEWRKTHDLG